MKQLVLPLEDFLAEDMERAFSFWGIDWGIDWYVPESLTFGSIAAGWLLYERMRQEQLDYSIELLGEWRKPDLAFFDPMHFDAVYDPELFMFRNRNKPWLQLYLPYPVQQWAYARNDAADLARRYDEMRERVGLPIKTKAQNHARRSFVTFRPSSAASAQARR